jgi:hypothetical protein
MNHPHISDADDHNNAPQNGEDDQPLAEAERSRVVARLRERFSIGG